jgi:hypothetical protein
MDTGSIMVPHESFYQSASGRSFIGELCDLPTVIADIHLRLATGEYP